MPMHIQRLIQPLLGGNALLDGPELAAKDGHQKVAVIGGRFKEGLIDKVRAGLQLITYQVRASARPCIAA